MGYFSYKSLPPNAEIASLVGLLTSDQNMASNLALAASVAYEHLLSALNVTAAGKLPRQVLPSIGDELEEPSGHVGTRLFSKQFVSKSGMAFGLGAALHFPSKQNEILNWPRFSAVRPRS